MRAVIAQPDEVVESVFDNPGNRIFNPPPGVETRATLAFFGGGVVDVADDRDADGPGHCGG
ncbi:MAG TPA: hypothetical protein VGJ73_07615 [Verrucomicrobiae bacterium]